MATRPALLAWYHRCVNREWSRHHHYGGAARKRSRELSPHPCFLAYPPGLLMGGGVLLVAICRP